MRRLQAVIPGPINAMYGETVAGTTIIRAFGVQSLFVRGGSLQIRERSDRSTDLLKGLNMRRSANFWVAMISRWFMGPSLQQFRQTANIGRIVTTQLLDMGIVSTALILILVLPGINGAAAGFMLAFTNLISTNVVWALRGVRQIEGISLERTAEYRRLDREAGEKLDRDATDDRFSEELDGSTGPRDWPSHGSLKVSELRANYGPDLPDILHDVSFSVDGGHRVGIVGATGGGKSTLAKAFFFFVDITHGKIEIDGQGEDPLHCSADNKTSLHCP